MAKKSPKELKDEGVTLGALIAKARKKAHNFALVIAKDEGVVLEADPRKAASVMWRQAKANGGTAKGAMGSLLVKGKVLEFSIEGDDAPPKALYLQTKKHLKDRGLAFKIAFVMPGGETLADDDDDDAQADVKATKPAPPQEDDTTPVAQEAADEPDATPDRTAELGKRLKELTIEVQALASTNKPAASKMIDALIRANEAIKSAKFESAQATLDKVEAALQTVRKSADAPDSDAPTDGDAPAQGDTSDAMRQSVEDAYDAIKGNLETIKTAGESSVAKKATQLEAAYQKFLESDDFKKASGLITLAKSFVEKELSKLEKPATGFMDTLSTMASDVAKTVGDAVSDIADAADDFVDGLTENGRKKLELQRLGYSEEDQDRIVADLEKNPDAVKDAKEKLVDAANIADGQKEVLKKLAASDPKAFEAAMNTLKSLEADGPIDASPEKILDGIVALEDARKLQAEKLKALTTANTVLADLQGGTPPPGSDWADAIAATQAAEKAWKDFNDALPEPATMTDSARNDAMVKGMELDRLRKAAAQAQGEAKARDIKAAEAAVATAVTQSNDAKAATQVASDDLKEKDSKRALLDALSFGRLSPDAKPAFKSEDKAAFIEALGKDAVLGRAAMDLASRADDPSVIARNVGFVADKMNDGFAAPDGRKLDLPEDQVRAMATNALQLGATQGQGYFDGFESYLASGKQLAPDPAGGLGKPDPDPKKETARLNKIALTRTTSLGSAVLGDDGKVDFNSDAGKAAMDHMMFHPGSLNTFSPQMVDKMTEMQAIFAGPKAGDAQALIDKTSVPKPPLAGAVAGSKIIAGTMGKDAGLLTDGDAKASVLSAMMTPISQGPVGSCFSTAPVRAIRETDPLRAMEEFQKIATTGQFVTADNRYFPADTNPPVGENPLMRSWEYSVATAAAEKADSQERKKLSGAITGPNALGSLSGVIPADKWNDTPAAPGQLPKPGIKKLLDRAIATQFKFEYNAGPDVGVAAGGGGDGHSSQGGYQIIYDGKALTSEAEFVAALKKITMETTGYAEDSDEGKAVLGMFDAKDGAGNVVPNGNSPMADAILTSYGGTVGDGKDRKEKTAPWNLASGGMEYQTAAVLEGKPYTRSDIVAEKPAVGVSRSARTTQIIQAVIAIPGGDDFEPVGTGGKNAAHAFNALPNHPSNAKISPPNSAGKIQSELIAPGQAMAAAKLPAERAARMFSDQIKAMAATADDVERPLLVAALKNRPTTDMTPQEVNDKIQAEIVAYRDVLAQKKADKYVADREPTADNARKALILNFFKDQVKKGIDTDIGSYLMSRMPVPEVVIADSNWGGPEGQTLFVAAPDPRTGDLILWKKDEYSGKMTPLGQNWEDGTWDTMAPTP